ncbi:YCP4 [Candida pseudojiufengensis]|uniref:YCP4 n=1 Tax=Candida pseudojiufengensis TaxID=497109 RepID=UPI002225A9BB|nr:YCP4 [Candida pseudojiufengensis]KAI5962470.1 YCP4 [Candida pseudojiufengensis]
MVKIAIIEYSTYGHIVTLSKEIQKGIEAAGFKADIYQIAETLPNDVLEKMHAPSKPNFPIATLDVLIEYDAFIFGFPTRFGNAPAQVLEFIGGTGSIWQNGQLVGKPAGLFTSSATQGSQEITLRNFLSILAHHGMPFVPLGYTNAFAEQANVEQVHGGSPYGAGTFAAGDGSRQPTQLELTIAFKQGEAFARTASKFYTSEKRSINKTGEKSTGATSTGAAATTTKPAQANTNATSHEKSTSQPQRAAQTSKAPETTDKSFCSKCIIM